jgi:hypothetical protein
MGSLSRKMKRRALAKQQKETQKDVAQKMNMFERLPDKCSACEKTFDKQNKEMVMTWSVVVRAEEQVVRLYCPECWDKAKKIIKEFGEQ